MCDCRPGSLLAAAVDQLDAVLVRIAYEADARPAFANAIRLALGLDPLPLQLSKGVVEVIGSDRDVPVPRAHVVGAAVVVVRELEHVLAVAEREEVVRRLD